MGENPEWRRINNEEQQKAKDARQLRDAANSEQPVQTLDNEDVEALLISYDYAKEDGLPLTAIQPNIDIVRELLANSRKREAAQPVELVDRVAMAICRAGHDSDEDFMDAWEAHRTGYIIEAGAAIAAMPRRESAQLDGWTLVPNVITLEMQHAYFEIVDKLLFDAEWSRVNGRFRNQELAYAAMLGAAPKPPQRDNVCPHDSVIKVAIHAMAKVDSDDVGSPLPDEDYEPYAKAVIGAMKREVGEVDSLHELIQRLARACDCAAIVSCNSEDDKMLMLRIVEQVRENIFRHTQIKGFIEIWLAKEFPDRYQLEQIPTNEEEQGWRGPGNG